MGVFVLLLQILSTWRTSRQTSLSTSAAFSSLNWYVFNMVAFLSKHIFTYVYICMGERSGGLRACSKSTGLFLFYFYFSILGMRRKRWQCPQDECSVEWTSVVQAIMSGFKASTWCPFWKVSLWSLRLDLRRPDAGNAWQKCISFPSPARYVAHISVPWQRAGSRISTSPARSGII